MQLHEVRARPDGQTAHNDYVLTSPHQVILQQPSADGLDQLLGRTPHFDAMGPDTPPEGKLAINALGGCIGQDGPEWAILGDQARRGPGTCEDNNGPDTCLFRERAGSMAHGVFLREQLALRLASCAMTGFSLTGYAPSSLHVFNERSAGDTPRSAYHHIV